MFLGEEKIGFRENFHKVFTHSESKVFTCQTVAYNYFNMLLYPIFT